MKKILSILLCSIICLGVVMLSSCEKEDDAPLSNAQKVSAKYSTVPYENLNIYTEFFIRDTSAQGVRALDDITVIDSMDKLLALDFGVIGSEGELEGDFGYDAEFFTDNALVLVKVIFNNYLEVDELAGLAVKDGRLCPVIVVTPPAPHESVSPAFLTSLVMLEVKNSDIELPLGEILVINRMYPDEGCQEYNRFE